MLCPLSNWVVCPRWWNGVPLVCNMLGSSGHNTENLTTNHSCAMNWERYHMLKNATVVLFLSRNHWAVPQEAKIAQPYPLLPVSSGNQNLSTPLSLCPHPIFHFIIISCLFFYPFYVHRLDILKYCCTGVKPQ